MKARQVTDSQPCQRVQTSFTASRHLRKVRACCNSLPGYKPGLLPSKTSSQPAGRPFGMDGILLRRNTPPSLLPRHHRDVEMSKLAASSSSVAPSSSDDASLSPVLFAVAVASMGAFAFGYHLGVVNGPLEQIAIDLGFAGNKASAGFVVSSTLLGAAIGSFSGGALADGLGRRASLLFCALPLLIGPVVSAMATSFNTMVVGRFIAGLAIGLSSALVPTYISEVAPTKLRGALGSLNQLLICIGILGALLVNVGLPGTAWRTMFYIAVAPAILLGLGMLGSPETPGYLASSGRKDEALTVARKLWGSSGPAQLESSVGTGDASGQGGWGDLFKSAYSKGALLGCILFMFQQFSGVNAIVYFSSSVFRQAGIQSEALASALVGATNVLGTLLATSIIEKAGRKQLLGQSYLGMGVAMLVMAAGFGLPALAAFSGSIAFFGTLAYILSFAIGAGPVTGLIVPELNSARVRGKAVSAAMVTHWVCNVAIGQNFISAVDSFGLPMVYVFFGVASLIGAAYINSNVPETKGRSFEEIQEQLAK